MVQHNFDRLGRPLPHEAEVAARRHGSMSSIRESPVSPARGTVKVNHVVAEIDGTRSVPFDYVTAECPIECEHRVSVFHWKGDMIKAPDASRLLSDRVLTPNCRASRGHAS